MEAVGGGAQENGGIRLAERLTAAEQFNHHGKVCSLQEARRFLWEKEAVHAARTAENTAHADNMPRTQRTHGGCIIENPLHRAADRRALRRRREQSHHMRLGVRERAERQAPPPRHCMILV